MVIGEYEDIIISLSRIGDTDITITKDRFGDLWVSSYKLNYGETVYAIDMNEAELEFKKFEKEARKARMSMTSQIKTEAEEDECDECDKWAPIPTGIVYMDDAVEVSISCEGDGIYAIEAFYDNGMECEVVDCPSAALSVRDAFISKFRQH